MQSPIRSAAGLFVAKQNGQKFIFPSWKSVITRNESRTKHKKNTGEIQAVCNSEPSERQSLQPTSQQQQNQKTYEQEEEEEDEGPRGQLMVSSPPNEPTLCVSYFISLPSGKTLDRPAKLVNNRQKKKKEEEEESDKSRGERGKLESVREEESIGGRNSHSFGRRVVSSSKFGLYT